MNVYFDNDVIHKLAACDLLDDALSALGVTQALVLATARYKFFLKTPEKGVKRYGAVVHARIADFISNASALAEEPDSNHIQLLTGVLGIDQGEAILFATAADHPSDTLLTGDKRSLMALAGEASCAPICARLAGRTLCFEQIVERIIARRGFEFVRERVAPSTSCDIVLQILFSDGLATREAHAVEGLGSYVQDLRTKTGNLLAK